MMIDTETRPLTRREALRQRRRSRPTRITIPARVSPHVRLVFTEMGRQRRTYDEVEEMSGVLRTTLKAWRHKNKPGLDSIEAVLGSLGWDYVPIPRSKALPRALVTDLEAIAAKHGLETSATIQTLIEIVARVHERFEGPPEGVASEVAPPTAPDIEDLALLPSIERGFGGSDTLSA